MAANCSSGRYQAEMDGMIKALQALHGDSKLLAMEIVEYNPYRDQRFETARAVHDLCRSAMRQP